MSAKVYLEIYFPALSKSYDFTIPASMGLSEAIDLMANLIIEKEKMDIDPEQLSVSLELYDPEKQDMLNSAVTLSSAEITDGKCLILV